MTLLFVRPAHRAGRSEAGDGLGVRWLLQLVPGGAFNEAKAPRTVEGLADAVVICQVTAGAPPVKRSWDVGSEPDLEMRPRFAHYEPAAVRGPRDSLIAHLSVPFVTLAKGDEVRLSVWDIDQLQKDLLGVGDNLVGEAKVSFDGRLPISLA